MCTHRNLLPPQQLFNMYLYVCFWGGPPTWPVFFGFWGLMLWFTIHWLHYGWVWVDINHRLAFSTESSHNMRLSPRFWNRGLGTYVILINQAALWGSHSKFKSPSGVNGHCSQREAPGKGCGELNRVDWRRIITHQSAKHMMARDTRALLFNCHMKLHWNPFVSKPFSPLLSCRRCDVQ